MADTVVIAALEAVPRAAAADANGARFAEQAGPRVTRRFTATISELTSQLNRACVSMLPALRRRRVRRVIAAFNAAHKAEGVQATPTSDLPLALAHRRPRARCRVLQIELTTPQ